MACRRHRGVVAHRYHRSSSWLVVCSAPSHASNWGGRPISTELSGLQFGGCLTCICKKNVAAKCRPFWLSDHTWAHFKWAMCYSWGHREHIIHTKIIVEDLSISQSPQCTPSKNVYPTMHNCNTNMRNLLQNTSRGMWMVPCGTYALGQFLVCSLTHGGLGFFW